VLERLAASPSFPWWAALGLQTTLGAAAAVAFGRSPGRRALVWVLIAVALTLPWIADDDVPLARGVLATGAALILFHSIDLMRDRRSHSAAQRVWFMLSPFDTRAVKRVTPVVRPSMLAALAGWAALAGVAFWLLEAATARSGIERWLVRWSLGAIAFYATVEAVGAAMFQGYLARGLEPPPLHRSPFLSRTVQEFWGERWNLEVRRWLHQHVFRPVARRRGIRWGVLAAFGGSTLLHVWIMLPAGGWVSAASWGAFFLVHGVFIVVERALGVSRWRPSLARAWTLTLFALSSPLFVEPLLRILP
jgi:hypothetical protein